MKAAVLREIGRPFAIADLPRPALAPHEALVQTISCGVCRTDLHIQDGQAYVPRLPHVPGHEPAGVVVEVGSQATGVRVGQRVVPHLFVAGVTPGIIGVTLPGGFAEYFKAPAANLLSLPDDVPFEVGGLVSCAVITAVHASHRAALATGSSAVVLGAGGVGLVLVQVLRAAGIRVLAIDHDPTRLEQALHAGAEQAVASDDTSLQTVRDFVAPGRDGVDCVFELVGRAQTMKAAAGYVARGGQIVVIGEEPEFPAIDTVQIAQRELRIVGARNGSPADAREALDLIARGVIRPAIAEIFPLERINDALQLVRDGRAGGRVVIRVRC
jgi:D-arabinose 1-dehydrogenase-like Zn-dependent alcohol dehydrogenase